MLQSVVRDSTGGDRRSAWPNAESKTVWIEGWKGRTVRRVDVKRCKVRGRFQCRGGVGMSRAGRRGEREFFLFFISF